MTTKPERQKTTVNLDTKLLQQVKVAAACRATSVSQLIRDAIAKEVKEKREHASSRRGAAERRPPSRLRIMLNRQKRSPL